MTCNAQNLVSLAKCFACMNPRVLASVQLSLLCQWANKSTNVPLITWEPANQVVKWTFDNLNKPVGNPGAVWVSGNLATFLATVDPATVTGLDVGSTNVTSVTATHCPLLEYVSCWMCQFLARLDLHGSSNIWVVQFGFADLSLGVDITGLEHSLLRAYIAATNCPAWNFAGFDQLTTVDANLSFQATSASFNGCSLLTYLNIPNSPNLTSLDITGCIVLGEIYCDADSSLTTLTGVSDTIATMFRMQLSYVAISSLSVVNFLALQYVDISYDANLTSLDCSGCTLLQSVYCGGSANLTQLKVTGCTALNYLDAGQSANLTSITDLSDCVSMANLILPLTGFTTLTLTSLLGLYQLNVQQCSSLTFVDCDNLFGLNTIDFSASGIGTFQFANCGNCFFIYGMSAQMTQAQLDAVLCTADTNAINFLMNNGSIDISSNPGAPPSATGVACGDDLVNNFGWFPVNY